MANDSLLSRRLSPQQRKTMVQLLMEQGTSMAPTPSRGAAVARALQGGLAGVYENWDRRDRMAAGQARAVGAAATMSAPTRNATVGMQPPPFAGANGAPAQGGAQLRRLPVPVRHGRVPTVRRRTW